MDRFDIGQVYGIHNAPNVPFGHFLTTPGPLMASVDTAFVHITGKGGHGATPHECVDPVVAVVGMVQAIQTIIPRNVYALDEAVISVTQIHTGTASNIIPEEAMFCATIRCFKPDVRALLKKRFHEIVEGHAAAYDVKARIDYDWGYPATINHEDRGRLCRRSGARSRRATMAWTPGPTARWGQRISPTCWRRGRAPICSLAPGRGRGCTMPAFDFNDEAAPVGASFFARLVERAQPLELDQAVRRDPDLAEAGRMRDLHCGRALVAPGFSERFHAPAAFMSRLSPVAAPRWPMTSSAFSRPPAISTAGCTAASAVPTARCDLMELTPTYTRAPGGLRSGLGQGLCGGRSRQGLSGLRRRYGGGPVESGAGLWPGGVAGRHLLRLGQDRDDLHQCRRAWLQRGKGQAEAVLRPPPGGAAPGLLRIPEYFRQDEAGESDAGRASSGGGLMGPDQPLDTISCPAATFGGRWGLAGI